MAEFVPFQLRLTGDTSDHHQFQGYDGYKSLAGFAWTLSLVANYVQTGAIRHRGDFPGRQAVRATTLTEGSIIADFAVWIEQNPVKFGGGVIVAQATSSLLIDIVKRTILRNIGDTAPPKDETLKKLIDQKSGDLDALASVAESSIRQSHDVIGSGANKIDIVGGFNIIGSYDHHTKDYVKSNIYDEEIRNKDFSVGAFDVNSGHGSVFDSDLGRTIPISMSKDVLGQVNSVFTWGIDQYANKTGNKVSMKYTRVLAMDGRPKKYHVLDARRA
jgi:hypothetical protein